MTYCILIKLSLDTILHSAFLLWLTYKIWRMDKPQSLMIEPLPYAYPSAPVEK